MSLRRILSHSAGLTVHGFGGYAEGAPVPTVQQVLDGEKPANSKPVRIDFVPGTMFRYSGRGYTVMQLLLTETAGMPFATILQKTILELIGMKNSSYAQPLPVALRASAAFAYRGDGSAVPGDYQAFMLFTLNGKGIAIMTNSDNGLRVAQELAYSIGEYQWKDYAPKTEWCSRLPHRLFRPSPGITKYRQVRYWQ